MGDNVVGEPKTMRGIVLPGDGTTELRTYDVPHPGEGEVVVKVRASGICGSDIGYIYRGLQGPRGSDGAGLPWGHRRP